MTPSGPPPPQATVPHDQSITASEVNKLVRDEIERSNKYLEFAQKQIEQDRSFYKHLYTVTGAFIAILVALVGYFFYSSISQMRTDMKATLDAEVERDKAALLATQNNADATVKQELTNVRGEVQKRLDTEFQSDNIQLRIDQAANKITQTDIEKIVTVKTGRAVDDAIKSQQPSIRQTIEIQSKESVEALKPNISAAVTKATSDEVRKSVLPIQTQMKGFSSSIHLGNLAILARNDDRKAFDYLVNVGEGRVPEYSEPEVRQLAFSTVQAIIWEQGQGLFLKPNFTKEQTPESMLDILSTSKIPRDRIAAIENFPPNDKRILPALIPIIESDPAISVLYHAVLQFNKRTDQSFEFFRSNQLLDWWQKNHTGVMVPLAHQPQ